MYQQDKFIARSGDLHDEAKEVTIKKNTVYGSEKDALDNYRLYGLAAIVQEAFNCVMKMYNYERALSIKGNQILSDEKFKNACLDLSNFAVMAQCFEEERRQNKKPATLCGK